MKKDPRLGVFLLCRPALVSVTSYALEGCFECFPEPRFGLFGVAAELVVVVVDDVLAFLLDVEVVVGDPGGFEERVEDPFVLG